MTEQENLREVVDAVTDTPDVITVPLRPVNKIHAFLQKRGWCKSERTYELTRLKVGNAYRISKAVLDIPEASVILGTENQQGQIYGLLVNHLDKVVYVVAVGLTNTRQEPSKSFLEEIRWQFTDEELLAACLLILKRVNISNFLHSIILIRGLDVVSQSKVSPSDTGETIAPGAS
ncbi:hypothetical protein Q4E40_02570 [Pontibacter sp. BT731]|uniref:hypothetical protein n=1 Tax=Pontibacter coccineus TaxID=3063328 RepID=UPI0026E11D5B|nr:hypothetical protein [Pontibacter sp. BT731]MDO6388996.1 hypothetical protein [Pontibacter sp. BT731]